MAEKTDTKTALDALRADLQECLARHTADPDAVLEEIWPYVVEALDFAQFARRIGDTQEGAMLLDPYADLSAEELETLINQRAAAADQATEEGLARSQGKWARDEQ